MAVFSSDLLYVSAGDYVLGDAERLDGGRGGDDTLLGDSGTGNDSVSGGSGYIAFGDASEMGGREEGGDDLMIAGPYVGGGGYVDSIDDVLFSLFGGSGGAQFMGDAFVIGGRAAAGDDTVVGAVDSVNLFGGDAYALQQSSRGGNDSLVGASAETAYAGNFLFGDGYVMMDRSTAGDDIIEGGGIFVSGGDTISGYFTEVASSELYAVNLAVGDALSMAGRVRAGNDILTGGSVDAAYGDGYAMNMMAGDAMMIDGPGLAGNDMLQGGDLVNGTSSSMVFNLLVGDGYGLNGSRAGNDVIEGGDNSSSGGGMVVNFLIGDAGSASGSRMGADTLVGGDGNGSSEQGGWVMNMMYGDGAMDSSGGIPLDIFFPIGGVERIAREEGDGAPPQTQFGNDVLYGGSFASNQMVGDTDVLVFRARGGNDLLVAGDGPSDNTLVGDAQTIELGARAGSDTLIGGTGNDTLVGDAYEIAGRGGADRFVISSDNGNDIIWDFRPSEGDRIDLSAVFDRDSGIDSYGDLVADGRVYIDEGSITIFLESGRRALVGEDDTLLMYPANTLTLLGMQPEALTSSAFIF